MHNSVTSVQRAFLQTLRNGNAGNMIATCSEKNTSEKTLCCLNRKQEVCELANQNVTSSVHCLYASTSSATADPLFCDSLSPARPRCDVQYNVQYIICSLIQPFGHVFAWKTHQTTKGWSALEHKNALSVS